MLTYCWPLPTENGLEARLQIHGNGGWFGIKEFQYRDRRVFRRGLFSGIDCQFQDPQTGKLVHLLMEQVADSPTFRPALTIDGQEVPESTGTPPPRVPARPPSLAIVTGITYLVMLMALVMLQPIAKILDAVYLRTDTRRLVLNVAEPDAAPASTTQPAPLQAQCEQLPRARVGEPYSATIAAEGGKPPYAFEPVRKRWPKALVLERDTGIISGVPSRAADLSGTVVATDQSGARAEGVFAIVVRPEERRDPAYPTILTERLPEVVVGEDYRFQLQVEGGQEPYSWETLRTDLPKGLELDKAAGIISGRAEKPVDRVVAIRVVDGSYRASEDMYPWVLPIAATAVCLIGFWGMRRWGVVLLAVVIVAELVLSQTGLASVSVAAMGLQGALLILGLVHWRAMD